jgi:hypothetical protein
MMTQAQEDHRNKMLELARQWRGSGTSARAFAQEHGITTWTLYYWRQRVVRDERSVRRRRRPRRVRLAPVHVLPAAESLGSDLEISRPRVGAAGTNWPDDDQRGTTVSNARAPIV